MIDRNLESIDIPRALDLRGKIAIVNAKIIYQEFRNIFHGDQFAKLRERGVHVQRVLWGSTGTKNPAYSDVLYVEELIGPETINTMPLKTISAFRDHGRVRGATVQQGLELAQAQLDLLRSLNIDLDAITEKLQQEGLAAFTASLTNCWTASRVSVTPSVLEPALRIHAKKDEIKATIHRALAVRSLDPH